MTKNNTYDQNYIFYIPQKWDIIFKWSGVSIGKPKPDLRQKLKLLL